MGEAAADSSEVPADSCGAPAADSLQAGTAESAESADADSPQAESCARVLGVALGEVGAGSDDSAQAQAGSHLGAESSLVDSERIEEIVAAAHVPACFDLNTYTTLEQAYCGYLSCLAHCNGMNVRP